MKSIEIFSSNIPEPVFTIAIPTFCRSSLLKEAVFSALNQVTDVPYDVIVVDNNPERNDETEQLMEQFKDNPLVGYYKNSSNLGMVGNWNQLFHLAKGQWVSMLHDDDLLYKNYIRIIHRWLVELDNPQIVCPSYFTSSNRNLLLNSFTESQGVGRKIMLKSFILGNIIGPPVGMVVNKEFFNKKLKFKEKYYSELVKNGNLFRISQFDEDLLTIENNLDEVDFKKD